MGQLFHAETHIPTGTRNAASLMISNRTHTATTPKIDPPKLILIVCLTHQSAVAPHPPGADQMSMKAQDPGDHMLQAFKPTSSAGEVHTWTATLQPSIMVSFRMGF